MQQATGVVVMVLATTFQFHCWLWFITFMFLFHRLIALQVRLDNINTSDDALALLRFKASITSDPLHLLSSWNSSISSPCHWTGIVCNNDSRVTSLNLKASNLSGTISAHLSNLTHLSYLNLSINNLFGPIPPQLGFLPSLTHLDFKENQLQGPIPPQLGNLHSLLWLDLSHNPLNGTIPSSLGNLSNLYMLQLHDITNLTGSIPPPLGSLSNLTYLYLGSNSLTGSIPPELGQLSNLKELYLILNKLTGNIPPELGQLQNLELLALFLNNFQGGIPPELGKLTKLKYMWLLSCNLQGTMPPELGGLQSLQELDLSTNQLSGNIPPELGQLENLQVLKLFFNNLNGSIPPQIGKLKNLQYLYMFSNSLSGEIPPEIGQLTNLQTLHLYSNNLTGMLPKELGGLQKLQDFILFSNHLHGEIPLELGEMKSLRSISLGDNRFNGSIPSTFANLANLQYLEMSINQIDGQIPSSLGKLSNLIYIDLSNNRLSGNLPAVLANCTKLQWIKLSNNSFSGGIPIEYSSLQHLHTISLARNQFTGPAPATFANHSSLVVLDLRRNYFDGGLPDSWAYAENLRILSLGYNKLVGHLPSWLWNFNQLQLLDLSNNNLWGTIPDQIGQMEGFKHNDSKIKNKETLWSDRVNIDSKGTESLYFTYLLEVVTSVDLSGNSISGEIPTTLGSLNGLFNLNLSSNMLNGSIPSSLANIVTLESLDFSSNLLTGQIPPQLTKLTFLAFLNLSNNHLSGRIPQGNQFNTFTNQSYLGNTDLCGFPLSSSCSAVDQQPTAALDDRSRKLKIAAGCVSGIVFGTMISVFIYCAIIKRRSRVKRERPKVQNFDRRFNLTVEELFRATEGYSDNNIVGRGGFSIVYRGVLSDTRVVAIKKFKIFNHAEAERSFIAECATLGQIRHKNLVKILGAYSTRDFKALVLAYLPNGSLDMHLYKEGECSLNWETRVQIAHGVAQGMVYLHGETGFGQILHCDLKPSNVLLDEDFEPHISDFGISKLTTASKNWSASASVFRGSIGYAAPEYAYGERLTDKADVYSFGVVLLEMLTRRRPTSEIFAEEGTSLPRWVRSAFPENMMAVIDPVLLEEATREQNHEIHSVVAMALWCTREMPKDRPTMKEALDMFVFLKQGKPHGVLLDMDTEALVASGAQPSAFVTNFYSSASSSLFSIDLVSSSDPLLFQ